MARFPQGIDSASHRLREIVSNYRQTGRIHKALRYSQNKSHDNQHEEAVDRTCQQTGSTHHYASQSK